MEDIGERNRHGNGRFGRNEWIDGLVQGVELLGRRVLLQELAGDLALGGEDDAVGGQDAQGGAGVGDGLEGIFDLVQTALGREDGRLWSHVWSVGSCRGQESNWRTMVVGWLTLESYLLDMVAV